MALYTPRGCASGWSVLREPVQQFVRSGEDCCRCAGEGCHKGSSAPDQHLTYLLLLLASSRIRFSFSTNADDVPAVTPAEGYSLSRELGSLSRYPDAMLYQRSYRRLTHNKRVVGRVHMPVHAKMRRGRLVRIRSETPTNPCRRRVSVRRI